MSSIQLNLQCSVVNRALSTGNQSQSQFSKIRRSNSISDLTGTDNREMLLKRMEQEGRVPSREKFRRMICNTYLCCGACPYGDRCVFLHDVRISLNGFKPRPARQFKSTSQWRDSFYWPDMSRDIVNRMPDQLGLPTVNQPYIVPQLFRQHPDRHDRAIFSMWSHLVAFALESTFSMTPSDSHASSVDVNRIIDSSLHLRSALVELVPDVKVVNASHDLVFGIDYPHIVNNRFVPSQKRLNVFVELAMGHSLSVKSKTDTIVELAPSPVTFLESKDDLDPIWPAIGLLSMQCKGVCLAGALLVDVHDEFAEVDIHWVDFLDCSPQCSHSESKYEFEELSRLIE